MSFGKSNAKVYVPSTEGIRFSDVAGEEEAKEKETEKDGKPLVTAPAEVAADKA